TENPSDIDFWHRGTYSVVALYDTAGEIATVSIADSSRHRWPVTKVAGPIRRINWLDRPKLPDADRRALTRAFNQAASYDERTRVASATVSRPRYSATNVRFAKRSHASRR